jgi:TfoX/Sxy family transcriptional regulator of competence genes
VAHRLRELLEEDPAVTEKKMFGGLCFLHRGNMCCGIVRDELMLRVGPDQHGDCLAQPHAREMDFTGRAMKGMIYVGVDGFSEDEDLEAWVERGLSFARSLPSKAAVAKKKAAARKSTKKKAKVPAEKPAKKNAKKAAKKRAKATAER